MNRVYWGLLAVLLAILSAGAAQAKSCESVSFPDQIKADGATLKLNGLGLRQATILNINVYVGALYLTQTSRDATYQALPPV